MTIDDDLLAEAKAVAGRSHRSLGEVVDDALRMLLHQRTERSTGVEWTFPTSGSGGLRPGVDLEDRDALAELLDS